MDFELKEKIVSETIEGETVIINLENGNYYNLNGTGSQIWQLIQSQYSVDNIVGDCLNMYEGSQDEMKQNILEFITSLENEALIIQSQKNKDMIKDQHSTVNCDAKSEKSLFKKPAFQKYTDMQDMLLIDPIHEIGSGGWPDLSTDFSSNDEK